MPSPKAKTVNVDLLMVSTLTGLLWSHDTDVFTTKQTDAFLARLRRALRVRVNVAKLEALIDDLERTAVFSRNRRIENVREDLAGYVADHEAKGRRRKPPRPSVAGVVTPIRKREAA